MLSRIRGSILLATAAAALSPSFAYVLVLRDGRTLSAIAPPHYEEGVACVALTGGEAVELRKDDVDEPATHEVNSPGVVDLPFSRLQALHQPMPQYSEELRKQKINGVPIIEAIFGVDGRVETVKVLRSVHPQFDAAVVAAIRQWQIEPARDDHGQPVRARTAIFVHLQPRT